MKRILLNENSEIESIVEFSQTNPWKPRYSASVVRRFLSDFVSHRDLIFDLHDDRGRVASAVLLDKVNNPANDACLEILGLKADVDPKALISKLVELAIKSVPVHRSGIQLALPDEAALNTSLIEFNFQEYYDTYFMSVDVDAAAEIVSESPDEITTADESDRDEVYEVLCESFSKNPEISIPEPETWKRNFLKKPQSHFYLWKTNCEILGFANLVEDGDSAEVSTIGVLSKARGLGVGNKLLHHCLSRTAALKKTSCHLTVAVQNENALGLYLRAGFKIIEKFKCYRKSV